MFVTKLCLQICTYIVIGPETDVCIVWGSHGSAHKTAPVNPSFWPHIGITRGVHWSFHEIAHVKLLLCHTLALHGVYIDLPMELPMCKAIVLPHIGTTWDLHRSIHETVHINHYLARHWCYMVFTLVGP